MNEQERKTLEASIREDRERTLALVMQEVEDRCRQRFAAAALKAEGAEQEAMDAALEPYDKKEAELQSELDMLNATADFIEEEQRRMEKKLDEVGAICDEAEYALNSALRKLDLYTLTTIEADTIVDCEAYVVRDARFKIDALSCSMKESKLAVATMLESAVGVPENAASGLRSMSTATLSNFNKDLQKEKGLDQENAHPNSGT